MTECLAGNAVENAGVLKSATMEDQTHYETIGVPPDASHHVIRKGRS
jgi:hypothetical protein